MTYFREFRVNWQTLLATFVGIATGQALSHYTMSLFAPELISEFGWSKAEFALVSALPLVTALVTPLAGRFTDRFGARLAASIGFGAISLGFFAMSAMRALVERGRKVPADVALVGFDDIPFAAYTTPPLTTIRQNCHLGARLLVEKLMRAVRHENNEPAVIPTERVVRASSLREHYRALPTIRSARPTAPVRSRKSPGG